MGNVVILSQDQTLRIICVLNLSRTKEGWASIEVNYQDRGQRVVTPIAWTGITIPTTPHARRLMQQRPDVYAYVAELLDGRSVVDVVNSARCNDCKSFRVGQMLPRPAAQYAPTAKFGAYIFEPATTMGAGPWLGFRILGPGKRKMRRFYGSWNGATINGRGWYEFRRLHVIAANHIRWMLRRTTPTELSVFASWADLQRRIVA